MNDSRLISIVLLVTLLTPVFVAPTLVQFPQEPPEQIREADDNSALFQEALAVTHPPELVRVAIYNEPNLTAPSYAAMPGTLRNRAVVRAKNRFWLPFPSSDEIYTPPGFSMDVHFPNELLPTVSNTKSYLMSSLVKSSCK